MFIFAMNLSSLANKLYFAPKIRNIGKMSIYKPWAYAYVNPEDKKISVNRLSGA